MARYSRRKLLRNTAVTSAAQLALSVILPAANSKFRSLLNTAQGQPARAPLTLRPPQLSNPTVHHVDEDNYHSLEYLGPGDHVIVMPDTPFRKWLKIDGRYRARHIVLVGGEISPAQLYDPKTMRLLDGSDYALYSQVGFTGANGGTFQIKTMAGKWFSGYSIPITAQIPYDASPETIRTAINNALGVPDACFAVDGPNSSGGPWKIVPANNAGLGWCSIIPDGLVGAPTLTKPIHRFNVAPHSVDFLKWTGTLHVEGLLAGSNSSWGGDATNIQCYAPEAIAQYANCHCAANFFQFHNDWDHPDGSQFYLGPAKFYAENVDFISKGAAGLIGQPRKVSGGSPGSLAALYDWWFKNVQFRSHWRDDDPHIPERGFKNGAIPAYQETDWPHGNNNQAGWQWVMTNCFANKYSSVNPKLPILDQDPQWYYNYFVDAGPRHFEYPSGLTLKQAPPNEYFCDPQKQECGIGYISPGYANEPLPYVKQRLEGERLLTR
jgi:hypothetical protein